MSEARCSGICGAHATNRPVWESPAKFGKLPSGEKVVWCPCCGQRLIPAVIEGDEGVAPNITTNVTVRTRRFVDEACDYDVVVVKDLAPA